MHIKIYIGIHFDLRQMLERQYLQISVQNTQSIKFLETYM